MEKLEVDLGELLLDQHNPRIGAAASQSAALEAIIKLDVRHFRTMMLSIKQHGLDPGDAFYLIEDDDTGEYIVVDGNRRLAALKILREPTLLQGIELANTIRSRLAKAAEGFDRTGLRQVDAVLFDGRSSADDWILRRHGRGLEGESRISWGSLEIQRFQKDRTVLDVIDFVERNSTFSDDRWAHVKAEVEKRPSVLKRFIEAKPFRKLLNLTSSMTDQDEMVPSFAADPKDALRVLSQLFEDIADGTVDTRTHNTAEEIEEYLQESPHKVRTAKVSTKFRDISINDKEERPRLGRKAAPLNQPRQTGVKQPRRNLAPSRNPFKQPPHPKGQRLLLEASRLRLSSYPLAAAYVLRAFLEYTIQVYMQGNNLPLVDKKGNDLTLVQRAEHTMDHLIGSGVVKRQDLRGVKKTLTVSTDPSSIQSLNDYHHDRFQVPTGDALRAAWDSAEPLFIAVYGAP